MGDFQKLSGSAYTQTKGRMEPEKEREPVQLSSTAAEIRKMKEQGGSDEQIAAQGPYPSTASAGASKPEAPPADIGQQGLSNRGADDATAGASDFETQPKTRPSAQQGVTERNVRNNA